VKRTRRHLEKARHSATGWRTNWQTARVRLRVIATQSLRRKDLKTQRGLGKHLNCCLEIMRPMVKEKLNLKPRGLNWPMGTARLKMMRTVIKTLKGLKKRYWKQRVKVKHLGIKMHYCLPKGLRKRLVKVMRCLMRTVKGLPRKMRMEIRKGLLKQTGLKRLRETVMPKNCLKD
jgi:hypothetical protein